MFGQIELDTQPQSKWVNNVPEHLKKIRFQIRVFQV